jgi:hypothetical protein
MTRGLGLAARAGPALLAALLLGGAGGRPGAAVEADDDDEVQLREVYIPNPEFQAYYDRDQLAVEGVTLARVRRPDQSEALVAKEESGWEHVVLEGWRLTFYNQAKQPLRRGPGHHVVVQEWSGRAPLLRLPRAPGAGTQIRREGTIRAGDCSLRVADLDQDGALERSAATPASRTPSISLRRVPLVPVVYAFHDRAYVPDNRRFPRSTSSASPRSDAGWRRPSARATRAAPGEPS